jgi:hypothetical protein
MMGDRIEGIITIRTQLPRSELGSVTGGNLSRFEIANQNLGPMIHVQPPRIIIGVLAARVLDGTAHGLSQPNEQPVDSPDVYTNSLYVGTPSWLLVWSNCNLEADLPSRKARQGCPFQSKSSIFRP